MDSGQRQVVFFRSKCSDVREWILQQQACSHFGQDKPTEELEAGERTRRVHLPASYQQNFSKVSISKGERKIKQREGANDAKASDDEAGEGCKLRLSYSQNLNVMQMKTRQLDEEKGNTFSPRINKQSQELERRVDNLYLWDEVRRIKLQEKKKIVDSYEQYRSTGQYTN